MSERWDPDTRAALIAALDLCGSVSEATLTRGKTGRPNAMVDARSLRALGAALEVLLPGAIANVRAEYTQSVSEAAGRVIAERQARTAAS